MLGVPSASFGTENSGPEKASDQAIVTQPEIQGAPPFQAWQEAWEPCHVVWGLYALPRAAITNSQTGSIKQQKCRRSRFWRPEACSQGVVLFGRGGLGAEGVSVPRLSPSLWGLQAILGLPGLVAAPCPCLPLSLCCCLRPVFLLRTLIVGFGAHPHPGDLILRSLP